MNANLENKSPGLNNPETHVLTHNRFNTYMALIFTDLKKAQIYKIPYRNSHHQEIEMVQYLVINICLNRLISIKKTRARKETNENFLFKIEDKKYIYVEEKIFTFKTIDDIGEYFSESGFSDVKSHFALGKENIY